MKFRKWIQNSVVVCKERSGNWPAVWEAQGPLNLTQNVKLLAGLRLAGLVHLPGHPVFTEPLCSRHCAGCFGALIRMNPIWWHLVFRVKHTLSNPALP